ncbi:hypothetical protein [Egbenema bharatensis]|uniref:hypothetical protein n=1 Tax=Egbenema bharatensis TaxID=3463334 RepID=UPI003A861D96
MCQHILVRLLQWLDDQGWQYGIDRAYIFGSLSQDLDRFLQSFKQSHPLTPLPHSLTPHSSLLTPSLPSVPPEKE